jgi:hypothetical protein
MKKLIAQYLGLLPTTVCCLLVAAWLPLQFMDAEGAKDIFTDSYWIIPLLSGIIGLRFSMKWGGFSSTFGRVLAFLSVALLLDSAGLLLNTAIYRITGDELPYPSVGDVLFLGAILSYGVGAWNLLRVFAPNKKLLVNPVWNILVAILGILILFGFVWVGFLSDGIVDERGLLVRILNAAYPILQLCFLFIALMCLFKVRTVMGGKMFPVVIVLITAICLVYFADYIFLYQSYNDTWSAAGESDILYTLAYGVFSAALYLINRLRTVPQKTQGSVLS